VKLFFYSLASCLFLIFSLNCNAQVIDSIHYSWEVFELEEGEGDELSRRCYVISRPTTSKTSYTGDRESYLAVTRFQNDRDEEVSASAGFEYKINSKIYTLVGDREFLLFTRADMAWIDSRAKDKDFVEWMLKSDFVKIRSDSAVGSYAIDEYSLKGFARAYKRMREVCP
jgi:hypothetical protein